MNLLLVFPVHTRIHIEKNIIVYEQDEKEQEQFEEKKIEIEIEIVQDEQFVKRPVQI